MRNNGTKPATILVADDDELLRTGIAAVLGPKAEFAVCALAENERRVLELIEQTKPQLLLLDLFLGHRDGLALIKDLAGRFPELRILVLSDRDHETFAERALRAGAFGYIMESASAKQLLEAIDRVLKGEVYLAARWRLLAQHALALPKVRPARLGILTDRELHVFQLIGLGLGTSRIARELGLSIKTIESYKEHLKNKLSYANAKALAAGAQEWFSHSDNSYLPEVSCKTSPQKNGGKSPIRPRRRSP